MGSPLNGSKPDPNPFVRASASEVFVAFLKLGLTSFSGPIAHLGFFRRELVERRRWVSESDDGGFQTVSTRNFWRFASFYPGQRAANWGSHSACCVPVSRRPGGIRRLYGPEAFFAASA